MARSVPPYAEEEDLLLGDMPLSSAISVEKFISDAADEIDVRIGHLYVVPVVVEPTDPADAPAPLTVTTLRIANARLASGRLLMAQAQAAQDANLHAYGAYLVQEAETLITNIANGMLDLDVAPAPSEITGTSAPTVHNPDAASAVDEFYGAFMRPPPAGVPLPSPVWAPGSSS